MRLEIVPKSKRDTLAVMVDILNSVNSARAMRKTTIVYKSNLNFGRTEKYLRLLLTTNLIQTVESQDGVEMYKITRKGQEFVSEYLRLMETLMVREAGA